MMYTHALLDNTDTPSNPISAAARGKFAHDYTTTHSADYSVASTDDKGQRRLRQRSCSRLLRGLH
jgi:hypothetical protein